MLMAAYKLCDLGNISVSLISMSLSFLICKMGHYFLSSLVAWEIKWINQSKKSMTHMNLYLAFSIIFTFGSILHHSLPWIMSWKADYNGLCQWTLLSSVLSLGLANRSTIKKSEQIREFRVFVFLVPSLLGCI